MQKVVAHRCEKSLKQGLSIRFCNPYEELKGVGEWRNTKWWLLKDESDYDYYSHYLKPITPIDFCPCCGRELGIDEFGAKHELI